MNKDDLYGQRLANEYVSEYQELSKEEITKIYKLNAIREIVNNFNELYKSELDYNLELVKTCRYCGLLSTPNDTIFKEHLKECRFNWKCNKNCLTCKHVAIDRVPPYPHRKNKYKNKEIIDEIGSHSKYVCTKKGRHKDIQEDDLIKLNRKCWNKYEDAQLAEIKDEEYIEYEDTLLLAIKEQIEIDTAIEDMIKGMNKYDTVEEKRAFIKEYANKLKEK